jgi:hypothetical protein
MSNPEARSCSERQSAAASESPPLPLFQPSLARGPMGRGYSMDASRPARFIVQQRAEQKGLGATQRSQG